MEKVKEILVMIGKGLWWIIQKIFLIIGSILQIIGNSLQDNSKHR